MTAPRFLSTLVTLAAATALPVVEAWDDLPLWAQRLVKWFLIALGVVLLGALTGCTPAETAPPATTGPTAPANREPEEDEPGWICSVNDDSCDETSY